MTVFAFQASCVVNRHPDGECHLVGFADHERDTKTYLMLQRSFEEDEQDVELGMNTYYVEWCGQERSGYGGVAKFTLKRGLAELTFRPEMAIALGGIKHLSIGFQLSADEWDALQEALKCIFFGSGCLEIADEKHQQ
ncbi:Imm10 family immunity protein [Inhella proteolytica]|uniref:Uncharacterized protein n=1 Tax=Inhella proteolytica TaxID=2795029 RepID=A0A931J9D3_9BURK|nr:Imm10 family immunity protein [Inhella proteolytica]MBH9579192.1 hypothetical protein [Inhella proteolytica]